jgi:hypothetical protein
VKLVLQFDLRTRVLEASSSQEHIIGHTEVEQRLLDVMKTTTGHNHAYPQVVILKQVEMLVSTCCFDGLTAEDDGRVVQRVSLTGEVDNVFVVAWRSA